MRDCVSGGKAKVSELDGVAMISDHDVFRLQITVVDVLRVAELDRTKYLKEDSPSCIIVPDVVAILCDFRK